MPENTEQNICYISKEEYNNGKFENKIIFFASDNSLNLNKVVYVDNTPILFPNSYKNNSIFFIDDKNNLCFEHDLLKSAFYLLSGYQETQEHTPDKYNRYPYEASVQYKLNCIKKPLVNYYFDWIENGLNLFYKDFEITKKNTKPSFILTHDIDFVTKYDIFFVGHKLKQLLGLTKRQVPFKQDVWELWDAFINFAKIINRPNPYWCFDFLTEHLPKATTRHIFFFLEKNDLDKEVDYKFTDKRIKKLFCFLKNKGCEIGIHGTYNSYLSLTEMQNSINKLQLASGVQIEANRQHFLRYKIPDTSRIHQKCGLKEDFSLGFAEYEGFRNSYCHPFKLYDFEKDCPINVWQYPLNVMDGTLFNYRELTFKQAEKSVNELLEEIKRFNGMFTLLWHNSFLDDKVLAGSTKFYLTLLKNIDKYF